MKVVLTDEALRDLDEILYFIGRNYPTVAVGFEKRPHTLLERIGSGRRARRRSRNDRVCARHL
jgi:plasmid stabilization system protein ParE